MVVPQGQPGRQAQCRGRVLAEPEAEEAARLQTAVPCGSAIQEPRTRVAEQVPANIRTVDPAGPAS